MTNIVPSNFIDSLQASYTYVYDINLIRNFSGSNKDRNLIIGCDSFSRLHIISVPQSTANRINRKLQSPAHTHSFHLNPLKSVVSNGIFSLHITENFLFAGLNFNFLLEWILLFFILICFLIGILIVSFAGGIGGIIAWHIKDIYSEIANNSDKFSTPIQLQMPQSLWSVTLETPRGSLDSVEVNSLCYLPHRGNIVCAGARSSIALHTSPCVI